MKLIETDRYVVARLYKSGNNYYHRTMDGNYIKIYDMDIKHLENTLNMLKKLGFEYRSKYSILKDALSYKIEEEAYNEALGDRYCY